MAFDREDAHRLIRQVRERSQGPGTTTLDALASALDAAVHEVNALEGTVGGLQSALDGQREHAERSAQLGHELQVTAQAAKTEAAAQERSALDSLAALLEAATARVDQLLDQQQLLRAELSEARQDAEHQQQQLRHEIERLHGELMTVRTRAVQQADTLARLATLPWWKRVFPHAE